MKVIHTYVDKVGVVWKELLYTQYLSAVLAKKHYGNISFYGDVEECKQISDLGLPYDEVNNKIVKREDTKTWSIPKLKVYESLDEPFLHIDTDTLLFNKIVFETYEQDYLFSHIDMHTPLGLSKDKLVSQLYKYYSNPPYENVKKNDGGHNYFYFNKTYSKLFFDLMLSEENKEKLFDNPTDNSEPIYSGKEVSKYKLLPPKKHIVFDRNNLQQVAPDNVYRAPQKLVYKTINTHIKIAIDDTQSLTTNSANIIIPNIIGFDIYTIMGILNSQLYSYLNIKLFGGVNKIAKENLQALPFPKISDKENLYIKELVMKVMETSDDSYLQNYIHKNIFGLCKSEIEYIFEY
jgi:hypothetical protein